MKTFIILVLVALAAAKPYGVRMNSEGQEVRPEQHQKKYQPPTPEQLKPRGEEYVRVCVSSSCELKKCQRMASELSYNVKPTNVAVPKEWSCIKASNKEQCLQWVKEGHADVVVARDDDVHKAIREYDLKPIAHEIPQIDDSLKTEEHYDILKKYEKITVAVVKSSSSIRHPSQLKDVPSCHAGVQHPASFKAPVCSLIEKEIIPVTGDHKESAADFFKRSCVPGILDPRVDRNGTNPVQLVEICGSKDEKKGTKEDVFAGYEGSIKCLKEGKGQVAFIDQNHIPQLERENEEYKLVCQEINGVRRLRELRDWKKVECQMGYSPRPTILTRKDKFSKRDLFGEVKKNHGYEREEDRQQKMETKEEQQEKDKQYNRDVAQTLVQAVTYSSQEKNSFKLFSSEEYKCDDKKIREEKKLQVLKKLEQILGVKITKEIKDEDKKQEQEIEKIEKSEEEKKEQEHKIDLIFRDNTVEIVDMVSEEKEEYEKPYERYMKSSDKCHKLQGKPRAKFCVTTEKEYEKCLKMKEYFSKTEKVRDVAWGCERAHSKLECMKKVYEGKADLISLKPEETFIAGREVLLQPILSEFHEVFDREIEGKKHYDDESKTTKTYTVGIIKKDRYQELFNKDKPIDGRQDWENKFIDLKKVKTCLAGVSKLSGFKHPIGHLLANGTIPRIGSIFESVQRHFERTCLPGAKHFTVEKDLILGHEFNWGHNTTQFANFTGKDFFTWNSPYTWSYYDLQKRTPQIAETIMKLPELLKSLEDKDLPEELKQKVEEIRGQKEKYVEENRRRQYKSEGEKKKDLETAEEKDEEIKRLFEQLKKVQNSKYMDEYEKERRIKEIKKQILKIKQEKSQQQWYESLLGDSPKEHDKLEELLKELELPALQHIKTVLDSAVPEHLRKAVPEIYSLLKVVPSMELGENDKTYLKHPAVQRFLQVYYPTLAKQLLKIVGDEFKNDKHNRYTSPIWLSPEYKEFLDKMRLHGEKLSESCEGPATEDKESERYYDYVGALKCLEEKKGDITFLPSHKLQEFSRHFHPEVQQRQPEDYALICPNGKVVPYVDTKSIKECNLGRVPYNAIVTDSKKTGTYRWNVTKALLHAQKAFAHHSSNEFGFKMFGEDIGEDSVFDKETTKLHPVPLVNQTFEVHLGPQLIRSLEAIVKPSSTHIFKQHKQVCYGEKYSNVIYQHNETCRAVVKTVTCVGEPKNKTIHLNKIGEKVSVFVEMISRPTRYSRKLVEFTCDTGYSYLKPVVIPEDCECVPKDEIVVTPEWNHEKIWYEEERKYHPTREEEEEDQKLEKKLWGNKPQWADRKDKPNFFKEPETREKYYEQHPKGKRVVKYNRLEFDSKHYFKKTTEICEKRHEGKIWEKEKKDLTRPVCPKDFKKTQYKQLPAEHTNFEKKLNEQVYTEKVHEHQYKIVDSRKSKSEKKSEEKKPF